MTAIEIERTNNGIDVVSIHTAPPRTLNKIREHTRGWLEGQQLPSSGNFPHLIGPEEPHAAADFPNGQPTQDSNIPNSGDTFNGRDPRAGERGAVAPLDESPILQTLAGGASKAKDVLARVPMAAQHPSKVTPEAVTMLGPEAKNLKGPAATTVNQLAQAEPTRRPATPEAIAAVNPEEFFNFGKVDASDATKDRLRQAVKEAAAEGGLNPKQVVGFDEVRHEAASLGPEILR